MNSGSGTSKINPLVIRPMTLLDLDSVVRIEDLSFPHPWTRDQFTAELERELVSRCHVAVMEDDGIGPAVGFIMAWLVEDELHITNLAVEPEVRRGGVAAALLEQSILEAIELGAMWCQLDVRATNAAARGLYSRFGFKPLGTRKRYYQNGEDAVVMGKELET
ncbi:MAG: ribosomal protein S18-alanine N-acetyltransferase [bacterium]|nr:ribosomal protein S18-alanine N-acetyltransferase [bacterium]MDT8365349.1 ribosomal protein S18-alanine N-acetyltransferase [bacterium]